MEFQIHCSKQISTSMTFQRENVSSGNICDSKLTIEQLDSFWKAHKQNLSRLNYYIESTIVKLRDIAQYPPRNWGKQKESRHNTTALHQRWVPIRQFKRWLPHLKWNSPTRSDIPKAHQLNIRYFVPWFVPSQVRYVMRCQIYQSKINNLQKLILDVNATNYT